MFGAAVAGTNAASQLIENHDVNLATVASVGAIVMIGTWRLSKQFQKIDDRLERLEDRTSRLWCQRQPPTDSRVCPEEKSKIIT